MDNTLISIVVITYNHENYFSDTIKGIINQQTSYNYEIIISDDNSTDNTDDVIKECISNIPNALYFHQEKNLGMMKNFIFALQKAKGKYIAICEGDDYWTDSFKLQKQVDFLEKNSDFAITFHRVNELANGKITDSYPSIQNTKIISDISDLAKNNYIPTLSVVFRNNKLDYPDWIYKSHIGDYPLHIINAEYGKIKFFPEIMGVYRKFTGIWSSEKDILKSFKMVESLILLMNHFKENKKIFSKLKRQARTYIYYYLKAKYPNVKQNGNLLEIFNTETLLKNLSFFDKIFLITKLLLKK